MHRRLIQISYFKVKFYNMHVKIAHFLNIKFKSSLGRSIIYLQKQEFCYAIINSIN